MGCDIHIYREKMINGKWVNSGEQDVDRNYHLFGILSKGVRSEHECSFEPRGIPFDVSPEVREFCQVWEDDGHSHSYLYLHEIKSMHQFMQDHNFYCRDSMQKIIDGFDGIDGENHRIVFWFDN